MGQAFWVLKTGPKKLVSFETSRNRRGEFDKTRKEIDMSYRLSRDVIDMGRHLMNVRTGELYEVDECGRALLSTLAEGRIGPRGIFLISCEPKGFWSIHRSGRIGTNSFYNCTS